MWGVSTIKFFKNWSSNERDSIIGRIEEKIQGARVPLKERIASAVYRLETQLGHLQQTSARLHQRDKEIFERCVGARLANDGSHSTIYANECVEIRKMAKVIMASELALERVILRLHTVEEFGDIMVQMAPIVGVVKETRGKLSGIIPEVSEELEEIDGLLSDTMVETGQTEDRETAMDIASTEAKKVLEEATAIAEQKMGERFPELPVSPLTEVTTENNAVALTEMPVAELQLRPDVNEKLLEYLHGSDGHLNIRKCAGELGVTAEDIRRALDQLKDEGKVRFN